MEKKKVLVGMSGGVDSAAAALLLREAGYEPVGCTLRLYDNEDIGEPAEGTCCSLEAVEDARRVCRRLGMEHYVFNFSDAFRRCVMDDFVEGYREGRTPNPCVQCNRTIKFAALARRADELEIPYIATGHYAQVKRDAVTGRWQLLRGKDRRKDQSYFLYPLTQAWLSRLLLPVGAMGQYGALVPVFCAAQACACTFSIFAVSAIQQKTPENMTGKVMACVSTISMCAQPLGQAVYGLWFDASPGWLVLSVTGAAIFALGAGAKKLFARW